MGKKVKIKLIGQRGKKGESAFDVAVRLGFVGTETEWLASLKGSAAYAKGQTIQLPIDAPNPSGFYDISDRYLMADDSIAVAAVPGLVGTLPYANGFDEVVSNQEVMLTAEDFSTFKFTDDLFNPSQLGGRFTGDTALNPALANNAVYVLDAEGQSAVYPAICFAFNRKFVITRVEISTNDQTQAFEAAVAHDVDSIIENGVLSAGNSSAFTVVDFADNSTFNYVLGPSDVSPASGENGFALWFQHSNPNPIVLSQIRLFGKPITQVENDTIDTTRLKLHRNYGTGGVDPTLSGSKVLMYVGEAPAVDA